MREVAEGLPETDRIVAMRGTFQEYRVGWGGVPVGRWRPASRRSCGRGPGAAEPAADAALRARGERRGRHRAGVTAASDGAGPGVAASRAGVPEVCPRRRHSSASSS
ncbi:hypothetical protein GCM10010308_17890 [Streptomyces vinaceusdrappus]|nr:hypothetical protein GCM10010308_17890 [Streptomyces vinaceusdrappus]